MKTKIVAIYDKKLGGYLPLFGVPASGVGVRHFYDEIDNTQSPMNKHPQDYELHELGYWETNTGAITPEPPTILAKGEAHVQE